ncbi:guanine nucleotide-binding protein [Plasmopara halstedii]|uniref:Guanine nucleotide-binding protein n=1 Tax=Plasmopara halstedii TaxID=4781 RepID=A0A0P1A4Q9_PLAHL|nr:guanine nucleotide-binding protein [Plasmopara halstedii]CEG35464.1 guanine nucleotide-binding protein [Plasmopara halstedii]|eukprot:XP_024571833.1 guanine nucleotide-binding protein [Plasmopara halstedii]
MVKKKGKSKRLSLHKKYKIARKVREHKRQERKAEKLSQHKKKKDPGIPNNWPFKEELLLQVEQARLAEIDAQRLAQQQRKEDKKKAKQLAKLQRCNDIAAVTPLSIELQAKKDLKHAVQSADVVFVVLDARDPQGSRSLSLEDGLVAKGKKKVVLVLNKIDLVTADTAQKWTTYLRRFHPTIPVRALNTQISDSTRKTKQEKGHKALYDRQQEISGMRDNGEVQPLRVFLDELANKSDNSIRIAIVGYPNVGKSTLINSIKRRQMVNVSSSPQSTKTAQEVHYGGKIMLIDCPALDPAYSDESSAILRHGIAGVFVEDPVPVVKSAIERADALNLMHALQIPVFRDHEEFLAKLAIKRNMLRKGGDPDILTVARVFLQNLGKGVFSPSCLPPAKSKSRFEMPSWYKELDLSKLPDAETLLYSSNPTGHKRVLTFKASPASHVAGETTEYDLIMGMLPENDGLTSEEEDSDDNDGDDGDEDEDVVMDEK